MRCDASWALASRPDGSFDRMMLFGSSAAAYVTWVGGTAIGALWGGALGDPHDLGLDALFPAFFLVLVWSELGDRAARVTAAVATVIAFVLIPIAPPGIPVVAATLAVLAGRAVQR